MKEIKVAIFTDPVSSANQAPAETKTITVPVYRDPEGNPTCARNFETGAVCPFYRTQRFGCHETCVFAAQSHKGITQGMERRGKLGFLIPLPSCPLWNQATSPK